MTAGRHAFGAAVLLMLAAGCGGHAGHAAPPHTRAGRPGSLSWKRENRELRRANQILKAAASFFAAELDRPSR